MLDEVASQLGDSTGASAMDRPFSPATVAAATESIQHEGHAYSTGDMAFGCINRPYCPPLHKPFSIENAPSQWYRSTVQSGMEKRPKCSDSTEL